METIKIPSTKHENRNNVLKNILYSIIGKREKVHIKNEKVPNYLDEEAVFRLKNKPKSYTDKRNLTTRNYNVEITANPTFEKGGKTRKSRKTKKRRKNRKSKRKQ